MSGKHSFRYVAYVVIFAIFATSSHGTAQVAATLPGSDWSSDFGGEPGFNWEVRALVFYNGELYAGGRFTTAGTAHTSGIARWDGVRWQPVGEGIDGGVYVLAADEHFLYAAGSFAHAGGQPANNIARWNGSKWEALASGVDDEIRAIALNSGIVYVGGLFDSAGGTSASRLAAWDGTDWHDVGGGVSGEFSTSVRALLAVGDSLYVAGSFEQAGDTDARNVALWNGDSWTGLDTPAWIDAFVLAQGRIYAGGYFVGSEESNALAYWENGGWHAQGAFSGRNNPPQILTMFPTTEGMLVGGNFSAIDGMPTTSIAAWQAGSWETSDVYLPRMTVWSVISRDDTIYVAHGSAVYRIFSGDWHLLANPNNGLSGTVRAMAVNGDDLYVGGHFTSAGGRWAGSVARWDGASWHPLQNGVNGPIYALAIHDGALYAGGDFSRAGNAEARNIAVWDGAEWGPVGEGFSDPVLTMVSTGGALIAGGRFTHAGDVRVNRIASWEGQEWSALGNGVYGIEPEETHGFFYVEALAFHGDHLYVVGSFQRAGESVAAGVARWNGLEWEGIGNPGDFTRPHAVSVFGDHVYVALQDPFGGSTIIRRWTGSDWEAISVPDNMWFDVLAGRSGGMFAAGNFDVTLSNGPARSIAIWDGSGWYAVAGGVEGRGLVTPLDYFAPGRVYAVEAREEDLYIAGAFVRAGSVSSKNVAHYTGPIVGIHNEPAHTPSPAFDLSEVYPFPASTSSLVVVTLLNPAHLEAKVVDLLGRHVLTVTDYGTTAGPHEIQIPVGTLAPGFYNLIISVDGRRVVRPLLVAR